MNIYAHRGNSGFFPENTMYAFKKSLDLMATVLNYLQ